MHGSAQRSQTEIGEEVQVLYHALSMPGRGELIVIRVAYPIDGAFHTTPQLKSGSLYRQDFLLAPEKPACKGF
jgi:hypothetical protein